MQPQAALSSSSSLGLFAHSAGQAAGTPIHSHAERAAAAKKIKGWGLDVTDERIRNYLLLKAMSADGTGPIRVSKKALLDMTTSTNHEESLIRTLWVVPKANLEADVENYIKRLPPGCKIQPGLMLSPPPGVNLNDFYFLTANVDRSKLGPDQMEHRTSIRQVASFPGASSSQAMLPPLRK